MGTVRTAITAVLVAALVALTAYTVVALPFFDNDEAEPYIVATAGAWLLFGAAVLALRRVPVRSAVVLILAGSVAIGAAAMTGPPNTSTDSARYAWDGIVQNAGISPYAHVPADAALQDLRTDWLFPAPVPAEGEQGTESGERADGEEAAPELECVGERIQRTTETGTETKTGTETGDVLCTAINRPQVPTIYPPTSELFFAAVRLVVGPEPEYWPLQLTGLLMSVGITVMLLVAMRRRGIDPRWAALWAWCPLVATEGITNSHIDLLGALLILAATLLVSTGRRILGGVSLGAAIAVKLVPVIAAPALLRRQPVRILVTAILTFAVLYVPYVLATGIGVLGYLPGYLSEEGYQDGSRFALLSLVAPGAAALPVAAVLLAVTAGLVWWKSDPANPWLGQVVMIGVTLLIVSPRYPWYALLLVPFIALSGRWEWLAVPLALTARLLIPSITVTRTAVAAAIVVILIAWWLRASPETRERILHPGQRVRRRDAQQHEHDGADREQHER